MTPQQESLFEIEEPKPRKPEPRPSSPAVSDLLVPWNQFTAWPRSMQLRYCASRDRRSALLADEDGDSTWTTFYRERARSYDAMAAVAEAAEKMS